MERFEAYYSQTATLRALEREFLALAADAACPLIEREVEAIRYGFALARCEQIRTSSTDVDLFMHVAPFRHWFVEQLGYFVDSGRKRPVDWAGLRRLTPTILSRVADTRSAILQRESGHIAPSRLDRELTRRQLVLALGGGGGAGYTHLGAFSLLHSLGIQPAVITGSSMGALLGLCRSSLPEYNADLLLSVLPSPDDLGAIFAPYRGYSRFCFPGAVEIRARSFGEAIFQRMLGRTIPRLSELPIRYLPVVTGLRTGIGIAISEIEEQIEKIARSNRIAGTQRRLSLFANVVRAMVSNPRFLVEVPFGLHPALRDFDAIDAMGFSCAVPGLLHYDIFTRRDDSVEPLRSVFAEHQLFRLTDGGVVNNVPSRVAATAVWRGDLVVRNAFVLSFDAFAPQFNSNAIFTPAQQFVRSNVLTNREYSDLHITWRTPPSPVAVIQSRTSLAKIAERSHREASKYAARIALAMRPLPPVDQLQAAFAS